MAMNRFKYFITFINNYSRYGWIDLLREKGESINALKNFKATVELKSGKLIKTVRSDRGGKFYGDILRLIEILTRLLYIYKNIVLKLSIQYLAPLTKWNSRKTKSYSHRYGQKYD